MHQIFAEAVRNLFQVSLAPLEEMVYFRLDHPQVKRCYQEAEYPESDFQVFGSLKSEDHFFIGKKYGNDKKKKAKQPENGFIIIPIFFPYKKILLAFER